MKKLVFFAALAFSQPTWACKPSPIPSCKAQDKVQVDQRRFNFFKQSVIEFQKILTDAILASDYKGPRSSCFNNGFANFYVSQVKPDSTCETQLARVRYSVKVLLNPKSQEWKAVTPEQLKILKEKAPVVEALSTIIKKH